MTSFRQQFRIRLFHRKYLILLLGLLQHLYMGMFLNDMEMYTKYIWPVNMVVLGAATSGIFLKKGMAKNAIRIGLILLVIILPIGIPLMGGWIALYMNYISMMYVVFFAFVFYEILLFLLKPGYINVDLIVAAGCGYFLLLEVSVFAIQVLLYTSPDALKNLDISNPATTYIDIVYFASVMQTSVGFGDITPGNHHAKLLVSVLSIAGQFYSVVLLGILISKFSSRKVMEG